MGNVVSQGSAVITTREVEVTPGTVVGGARDRVYGVNIDPSFASEFLTSGINTGGGGTHSVRAGTRGADLEVASELAFGLNHAEIEDFMRTPWTARKRATSVSVTFDNTGTHLDATAGPTITGGAGAFTALLGTAGCMLEISGVGVAAANRRPRKIKAVSATQIDLDPRWVAGASGAINEPLTDEGPVTATLDCGILIYPGQPSLSRSINIEQNFSDVDGGSFQLSRGLRAGTMSISGDGKGIVTLSVGYVGMDFDAETTVTAGNGTVNANPYLSSKVLNYAEDLTNFVVNGAVQLAGKNLTGFTLDLNGDAQAVTETSGTRFRTGVTVGDITAEGGINCLHVKDTTRILQAFGRAGTHVSIDQKLVDPAGNYYWICLAEALLSAGGAMGGGASDKAKFDLTYTTQVGKYAPTIILQAFAA